MAGKRNTQEVNKKKSIAPFVAIIIFLLFAPTFVNDVNAVSKIPKVRHSVKPLDLSKPPTTEELMSAGQLGGQLFPTSDIEIKDKNIKLLKIKGAKDTERINRNKAINLSFGHAIQEWNKHEYKKAVELFRKHIEEYPDSPWVSEAVLHIGCDARYNGRYSEAEEKFRWIMEKNKDSEHAGAKMLLNKARSRLAILKVLQSNFNEAVEHFRDLKRDSPDWRQRTYASHWIQRLSRYKAEELAMLNCGVQALARVLEKDGKESEARAVMEILPSSLKGHSIKELKSIAEAYGYSLSALRVSVSELSEIPLPAVVQINGRNEGDKGHYWVLEKSGNEGLEFFDQQSGRRFRQSLEEFSREWNGNILVFSDKQTLPGIKLAESEMEQIYGGCCGMERPEEDLGDPGDDKKCYGAPVWSANVVNMNFFVTDTPLWYSNPVGPSVEISLSYNSQSALAQYEPFGNKWQFNYGSYLVVDTGDNVTIFMPDGRRDVYTPNGNGGYDHPYQVFNELTKIAENHFELRLPDDTVYVHNIPAGTGSLQPFLVEIRDAYGQSLTFGYNTNVQFTTITDALGRTTNLTYNPDGLVTQIADPFGRSANFEYDVNHNLTKITDMGGYWSSLSYDGDVYLTSIENEKGRWEFYIEPADGISAGQYPPPGYSMWENYRITITDPIGGKEEYFYDGASTYTWYISPINYIPWESYSINNYESDTPKTKYYFSQTSTGRGNIREIRYPEGGYVLYNYDSNGNRTGIEDSHSHKTRYTYNDLGRITSITDANGITTNMTYDTNDVDLLEIQDGLGTITMTYNGMHDVALITDRLGNKTEFTYNSFGQIESRTDAKDILGLEVVTAYTYYDSSHASKYLFKEIIKDSKTLESFTYDTTGRVKDHTDTTGLTLTYDYNNLDNITKITYPDTKFISYTYSSCCPYLLDSETDRSGRITNYTYDNLKRLIETVNPEGGVTRNEYDPNGNLVKLIDPNSNVTAFVYDLDNRLIKKTYADGKYISFIHDTARLISTRINARGITTSYTYDKNHNLRRISYSDNTPGVTYQYDDYNRVMKRQDGTGIYQFSYDANSQLLSVDGPWVDDTLTYQYDELGRRKSLVPQLGQAVSFIYDNLNRLTDIQTGTNTYSYAYTDANPLIQNLTRPNTSVTSYQYDNLNRLTEISNKDSASAIINQYVYAYDPLKDVRSSETITNGNPITSFQNELITYDYNKVNQLLSSTNPIKAFTYDDDGNMTQGYTPEGYVFTAAYDAENRLKSIEYTDSGAVVHKTEYLYSGDDFLAEKKEYEDAALVDTTRFVRSGFLPVQERDASNSVIREYTWGRNMGGGIGGLINLNQAGQDYSYLYDGKGNVSALIDNLQAVTATYTYDTFGKLMSQTGTLDQPFQFSTKQYDENLGLSYYGYRHYSSSLGRWITRDPLGEGGGINLYGFVNNNTISYIDYLGLDSYYVNNKFDTDIPTNSWWSHSFAVSTDINPVTGREIVTDTYSWTNEEGGSWDHNYAQDRRGAQKAIDTGVGVEKYGGELFDFFVAYEYEQRQKDKGGFWGFDRGNCKMQAGELLADANRDFQAFLILLVFDVYWQ